LLLVITDKDLADDVVRRACDMRTAMIYTLAERERAGELSAEEAKGQREALEGAHFFSHAVNTVMVTVPHAHRKYGAVPTSILSAVAATHNRSRNGELLPFSGDAGAVLIW
jgi:hypothetical protein